MNESARKLDVLIVTHGKDGLAMVEEMQLPVVAGVHYIVTWQSGKDTTPLPWRLRDDIEVHQNSTTGSSDNRNEGLRLAKAPYCLFADNDLRYNKEELQAVIHTLDQHKDIDVATFRHSGEHAYYPSEAVDITERMPKGYSVATFEIAFRRKSIGNIRFDPNFGVAAPLAACEDNLFLLDCRRAGLRCRFFPITIVEHRGLTTGYRVIENPRVAMAEGAFIRLSYGLPGYARVPLFAWRAWRKRRMPLFWGLLHLTRGFFSSHVKEHRKLTKTY